MILHLFDDEKIINRVIELLDDALPNENLYVCFLYNGLPKLVKPHQNLFFYRKGEDFSLNLSGVDKVMIHYLDYNKVVFCRELVPEKTKIYWVLWGADMYNTLLENRGYRLFHSRRFFSSRSTMRLLAHRLGYVDSTERTILNFISQRVSFFISDCEGEFDLLRQYLPKQTQSLKHYPLFYYPIEQILNSELLNTWAKGDVILVGNSASFTNNHGYAFKYLSKIYLQNKRVVVPISYGGTSAYRDYIKESGKKMFGQHFLPLDKFMPLEEYNKLMTAAEVCIYGSWRQEAVGNITIALYLGAKVFLSKRSPLLSWYRKLGITIFELESITDSMIMSPLSLQQKERNRAIIKNRYSRERFKILVKNIFKK